MIRFPQSRSLQKPTSVMPLSLTQSTRTVTSTRKTPSSAKPPPLCPTGGALRGKSGNVTVLAETGSNSPDITMERALHEMAQIFEAFL